MYKWYLPTLSEIIRSGLSSADSRRQHVRTVVEAEQSWKRAIASLNTVLTRYLEETSTASTADSLEYSGFLVVGPGSLPLLEAMDVSPKFSCWQLNHPDQRTPPSSLFSKRPESNTRSSVQTLSLYREDPLAAEPFCLVLTSQFGMVMTAI